MDLLHHCGTDNGDIRIYQSIPDEYQAMTQSHKHSMIEALANVAIGAAVSLVSQMVVFPFYGIHIGIDKNMGITAWFTVISIVRSYCLRRWFNRRT